MRKIDHYFKKENNNEGSDGKNIRDILVMYDLRKQ